MKRPHPPPALGKGLDALPLSHRERKGVGEVRSLRVSFEPVPHTQPATESASLAEDLQPKRRPRGYVRRFHRWVGGLAALFIVALAVTGFLLNHPTLLGRPSSRMTALAVDPQRPAHLLKATPSGLFASEDGGETWDDIPVDATDVTDVAFANDRQGRVYATVRYLGLIRSDDGGRVWENVPLPFAPPVRGTALLRVVPGPVDTVTLITSEGVLSSPDLGRSWTWKERQTPSEDLHHIVHQIHTGYLLGRHMVYLYDFAAWALVALAITGFAVWGWRNGRSKNGR